MQYGICPLSIVPIRTNPDDCAEMSSQLLYGEHFKVLEARKKWSRIRTAYDNFEGWIPNNQLKLIAEDVYKHIEALEPQKICSDVVSHICTRDGMLQPIIMGSMINSPELLEHTFEGHISTDKNPKDSLVDTAIMYLKAPYLAGGKTPFGIDCSGFTQMVYKINGYTLARTAEEQSKQGEALSFIEESEPGDLAFFDDNEGIIDHVGIILKDNYIIHVNGHVRIDRIDHTGIFNSEEKLYTHQLRVIKKVI
ncbi:MAG: C40 family peptidase [Bacteroidota bacterium]|uniref:C40 family peptidase n=1 Tax=Flagellimonas profundi TaxID=2915620 RepID=A0ABS3FBU8_9FLAO|nr:C40 family peptidase [Allomuricauda profundi]MBO0340180.1 C40 family peptidase [Allomuricauda profundi]MEC7769782.1 C40 family peptidase [Bacteroidota bacterium]